MNADIRDESLLKTLEPTSLVSYLRSRQWDLIGKIRPDVPVFSKGPHEVFLPLSKQYADYGLRMGDLLKALEADEERSQLEIFEELVFTAADRIQFRLKGAIAKRGSLPINLGVQFFERSRDVIYAAACASVECKPYFHGRRSQQVEDYMKRVYLGQTARGSFILNAGSPVSRSVDRLVEEEPYERTVTKMLLTSVASAKIAAQDLTLETSSDPFLEASKKGVSANLCAALADLFLDEDTQLEIGLQWSPLRSMPQIGFSTVTLESDLAPIFAQAAHSLKSRAPREDFKITGSIVRLARPEGQDHGQVVIYGMVDETYRRVRVALEPEDYDLALHAHSNHLPVTLSGELIRRGKAFELKHPRNLQVLEFNDDSSEFQLELE